MARTKRKNIAAYSMESSMLSIRYAFRIDSIRMKEIFFSCGFFDNMFIFFRCCCIYLLRCTLCFQFRCVFMFRCCKSHETPDVCVSCVVHRIFLMHMRQRATPNYFSSAAICAANQRFFFVFSRFAWCLSVCMCDW